MASYVQPPPDTWESQWGGKLGGATSSALSAGPAVVGRPWTMMEQLALDKAIGEIKKDIGDARTRWTMIAERVPDRSMKECVARYKELRTRLQAEAAARASGDTAAGSGGAGDGAGGSGSAAQERQTSNLVVELRSQQQPKVRLVSSTPTRGASPACGGNGRKKSSAGGNVGGGDGKKNGGGGGGGSSSRAKPSVSSSMNAITAVAGGSSAGGEGEVMNSKQRRKAQREAERKAAAAAERKGGGGGGDDSRRGRGHGATTNMRDTSAVVDAAAEDEGARRRAARLEFKARQQREAGGGAEAGAGSRSSSSAAAAAHHGPRVEGSSAQGHTMIDYDVARGAGWWSSLRLVAGKFTASLAMFVLIPLALVHPPPTTILSTETVDPISLDPIAELEYPPFELSSTGRGIEGEGEGEGGTRTKEHTNLFDGRVLAYYMVSTANFQDPLTRRELTREECRRLDQYLEQHRLKRVGVVESFDLLARARAKGQGGGEISGEARSRQSEAAVLFRSLFSYNDDQPAEDSARTGPSSGPAALAASDLATGDWPQPQLASQGQGQRVRKQSQPFQPRPVSGFAASILVADDGGAAGGAGSSVHAAIYLREHEDLSAGIYEELFPEAASKASKSKQQKNKNRQKEKVTAQLHQAKKASMHGATSFAAALNPALNSAALRAQAGDEGGGSGVGGSVWGPPPGGEGGGGGTKAKKNKKKAKKKAEVNELRGLVMGKK